MSAIPFWAFPLFCTAVLWVWLILNPIEGGSMSIRSSIEVLVRPVFGVIFTLAIWLIFAVMT